MAEINENTNAEIPKGRALILEAYKTANPDRTEDPQDDELYDFAHNRYSDLDNRYNELSGANNRLAGIISKDPRIGAVVSMISGEKPKSLPYAFSSVFGKDATGLEGSDLEDFESGYQEYLKAEQRRNSDTEEANKNFEESIGRLFDYIKTNKLDDEKGEQLYDGVLNLGKSFLMGIIPNEIFDLIYKGLNYDNDVQDAADTGFVEGKNTVVEAKMKNKTQPDVVPNLEDGTRRNTPQRRTPAKRGSFYDAFKEKE